MKSTFGHWASIGRLDIDTIMDYILTGWKAKEAKPDPWLLNNLQKLTTEKSILDFGCGVGRNALAISNQFSDWDVIGYDSENMIANVDKFYQLHYSYPMPKNVNFLSDWDSIKSRRFGVIACILVLQHIKEDILNKYITDFKVMTNCLVVAGRRFNDDSKKRSTWKILEENGLVPTTFYAGDKDVPYFPDGDPEKHNIAVYRI